MSESPPAPRPEPLRVPVVDVATRSSLVSKTPQPMQPVEVQSVVVQRAVRVISDVPPAGSAANGAQAAPEPSRSAPPPAHHDSVYPAAALDGSAAPQSLAAAVESYASVEVEPLDPLELAETLDDEREPEDELGEEDDEEPHVLEVSVPPPAPPPQALRRSAPNNDNHDVEITVSEDDEDEEDDRPSRPSGEFEELDLDAEQRDVRSVPPPPPPPRTMAEPPDLSTLTRTARVQEIRPSKPRPHPWWEVFFDDDYLRTVRPPTREQIARQCDFLERRLGLKPAATLLDVGCGLGLQVVELCARGYLGVGLDLSLAMLSRASEEAQGRGMRINFLHGDMRDMNFEGNFDAVTCLGTSFGYFDDDTNRKVLERLLRALKPGGALLLDMVNRDHVIRSQPNLVWFEGDGCVCMEESEFNFFTSRLHVKRTVILDGGKQTENEYSLRLYSLHELGIMLHNAGFRVTEVSGREAVPGVFFGQESPQIIVVAERRVPDGGTGKYPALQE